MPLQIAPVEEIHKLIGRAALLDGAIVDINHFLRIELNLQLGWFYTLLALVVQRKVQIH